MKKIQLRSIKRILTEQVEWIGLPENEFHKYGNYINRETPGICGTYAATALTHYVVSKDHQRDLDIMDLIEQYRRLIDEALPYTGTFWWDVVRGLKQLLNQSFSYRVKSHMIAEKAVVQRLNQTNPLPIIVGTLSALGSPYRNHWLLVYAYAIDSKGKLWFKAYDNHGNYRAILPASQTIFAIWLEKVH